MLLEDMKSKRSCSMQTRKYHKVKLKTASGGSLTIRYRRPSDLNAGDCSSASGSSSCLAETTEASITSLRSERSLYNACNTLPASMNDQYQAFDDLADLPEYSQMTSCVSGVPDSDACDVLHSYDIQPAGFTSPAFWSPDHECNSSDIGSNEVLPELPEVSCFDINPVAVSESCLEETENSTCWPAFQEMQHFSHQQNAMQSEQLKFSADGTDDIASTLLCMEAYEEFGASFWSTTSADGSVAEEQLVAMQSSHMSVLCLPSILTSDIMDSSEVELIDLPPLLHYDVEITGGLQGRTLQQFESIFYEDKAASFMEVNTSQEDAEYFDESSFLNMLDPGMPDEVSLENSGMLQGPWGAHLEHTLQDNEAKADDVPNFIPALVKEAATQWPSIHGYSACRDEPSRLPSAADSAGHEGRSLVTLSDPVGPRGKNIRRKRVRRATPLHTLKSLLSSTENIVPGSEIGHDVDIDCMSPTCDKIHVFSRKTSRRRKAKASVSNPEEKSRSTWHAPAFRSIDEIHSSDKQIYMQKQTSCCTSSEEDEMQGNCNRQVHYVSSQRRRMRSRVDQGRVRRRPDSARRAPRYSSLLPEHAVSTLRKWFDDHISYPFADKEQKLDLVSRTGLKITQVDNWLSNYRHRLKVRKSDYEGNVLRPEKAWTRQ